MKTRIKTGFSVFARPVLTSSSHDSALCFLHYKKLYITNCCRNNICQGCLEDYGGSATGVAELSCPHCMVPTLAVTPATPGDATRNYSNTPTSAFGSSSAVLGTLITRDLRSELKNERRGTLIRKMLPFEDRLGDNEINNAEAGEEARMIPDSDNIAVSHVFPFREPGRDATYFSLYFP